MKQRRGVYIYIIYKALYCCIYFVIIVELVEYHHLLSNSSGVVNY